MKEKKYYQKKLAKHQTEIEEKKQKPITRIWRAARMDLGHTPRENKK